MAAHFVRAVDLQWTVQGDETVFLINDEFEVPAECYAEVVDTYEIYFDRLDDGKIRLNKAGLYM